MIDWTRPNLRRETPRDFAVGLLFFAVAFAIRYLGEEVLNGLPFVTFTLAVLFTAYFGGWRVAIFIAVASSVSAWYFFLEPSRSWTMRWPQGPVAITFFMIVCASQIALVAMLVESLRRRDAKRMELERQRALQQTLFQELQHRVANGMQLISSILSLQARLLAPQSAAKVAIDAAASRLSTLARVHRRLHDPSLGGQGIGPALKDLAQDVLAAAGRSDVAIEVEAPGVAIAPAAGTSLAMVVAEATTNSLKHAFVGREGGTLAICLRNEGANWDLRVTDDGPGFGSPGQAHEKSLGLMIIRSMANRLGGEVEFANAAGGGAQIWLRFPDPSHRREDAPSQPVEQPTRRSTDRERAPEAEPRPEQA